jgi:hypothetical protein
MIHVDGTPPGIEQIYPLDGAILNDPYSMPAVFMTDPGSGISVTMFHLEGPTGSMERTYTGIDGTMEMDIEGPLPEGRYSWSVTGEDLAGNRVEGGPFEFVIDLSPPLCFISQLDPDTSTIIAIYDDLSSCPSSFEVRCQVPSIKGLKEVFIEGSVKYEVSGEGYRVETQGRFPSGVSYVSVRAMDKAGNIGPWSDLFRLVPEGTTPVVQVPPAFKTGEPLTVTIEHSLGVNPESVVLRLFSMEGMVTEISPSSFRTIGNSTVNETTPDVPVRVMTSFDLDGNEGEIDARLLFTDAYPMPVQWASDAFHAISDPSPPSVNMKVRKFYTTTQIGIPVVISDKESGISMVEVSVGGGPFIAVNSPFAPSLAGLDRGDEKLLRVNLSFGPATSIELRVWDLAGNFAISRQTTRATRPPDVFIDKLSEDDPKAGTDLVLKASGSDPDGDNITFLWYIDGILSGEGRVLEFVPDEGVHNILLNCTDGYIFTECHLILEVEGRGASDGKGPSKVAVMTISFLLIILLSVMVSAFILYFRNRERDRTDVNGKNDETSLWIEDEEDENVINGRGSSGSRGKRKRCDICLRPLRSSSGKQGCRCGASFHRSCAVREGECPECGREIMLKISA